MSGAVQRCGRAAALTRSAHISWTVRHARQSRTVSLEVASLPRISAIASKSVQTHGRVLVEASRGVWVGGGRWLVYGLSELARLGSLKNVSRSALQKVCVSGLLPGHVMRRPTAETVPHSRPRPHFEGLLKTPERTVRGSSPLAGYSAQATVAFAVAPATGNRHRTRF